MEAIDFDKTDLAGLFQPERVLIKRTTLEVAQKWHSVKIQMINSLKEATEKLATKNDWLIAALYALGSTQVTSSQTEMQSAFESNNKNLEALDKAI